VRFIMYWTAATMAVVLASPAWAASQRDRHDCEAKDPDRSITGCTRILQGRGETAQNRAKAYNNRGNAWRGKGEYDRAIADYSEAIRLNPKYTDAYYNRGVAWRDKGDLDKGIADYSEVIRLDPKDATAYSTEGWQISSPVRRPKPWRISIKQASLTPKMPMRPFGCTS
jgi:tetratricopeptide (TPR) repeat protein